MSHLDPVAAAEKLDRAIGAYRASAAHVVTSVLATVPDDSIVRADALAFDAEPCREGPAEIRMSAANQGWTLHPNAMAQLAERASIPLAYVNTLRESSDPADHRLLAYNLGARFGGAEPRTEARRMLVRAVGGEARAVLSDKYRRLDSRPILESMIGAVQRFGAVPYSGHAGEVRFSLKAILPRVFEIIPGEPVALGIEGSNSDFGAGALAFRAFLLRLTCLNGATTEDVYAKRHLGKRLDDSIEYSRQTYALDTKATASAIGDVVSSVLSPAGVETHVARLRAAAEDTGLTWSALAPRLGKSLSKDELRRAGEAFDSPDVVNLPPGASTWRASNAISWIAHTVESPERKLELEKAAGALLAPARVAA